MNKILIVSPCPHHCIGGMETYNYNLIKLLKKNGFEVDEYSVYIDNASKQVREPLNDVKQLNKAINYSPKNYLKDILINSKRNKSLEILSNEYDIIINSSVALKLNKKIMNSKKWIYVQHFSPDYFERKYILSPGFSHIFKAVFFMLGIKNPLKHFMNIVFFSDFDKEKVRNKKDGIKTSIYLSSLSKKEILNNYKKHKDEYKKREGFMYLGRMCNKQKNINELVKLFERNNLDLDLYGLGDKKIMNNTNHCHFRGKLDKDEVKSKLLEHKFLMLYSKFEGFPFSIVESLSLGVPIITTDSFCCAKLLASNKGFIINKNNANEIIDKARSISSSEYNEMVEECFRFSLEYLSMETFESNWMTYINGLINKNTGDYFE
ncbi:MAG: glycosyltransferase family 4 protein [Mycoplasma sp.]